MLGQLGQLSLSRPSFTAESLSNPSFPVLTSGEYFIRHNALFSLTQRLVQSERET
jgi:hypothetical protein